MRDSAFKSVAVGFFDGVHAGHRAILANADAAITFREHPLSVVAPDRAPRLIMSAEDRIAAIRACGVDEVIALKFDRDTARLSPKEFSDIHFLKRFGTDPSGIRIICGENWRFGKDGVGDAQALRDMGYGVTVVPYAEFKGAPVSSSRIRDALECGHVEDANAMLGRRFGVSGVAVAGKGEGRRIGWPTLNLELPSLMLRIPLGVYEVVVDGSVGIANYGLAPTFGERAWSRPVMEVHFPDVVPKSGRSNSRAVELVRFVRQERKFDSIDGLKRQIAADCEAVFGARHPSQAFDTASTFVV